MTCTVTVVVPLYNKENEIVRCLKSILSQTFLPIEILIIDNLSTDRSVEKAKNYVKSIAKLSKKVHVIFATCENKGAGLARNLGFSLSRGNFIAFLDADDYWRENHLAEFINARKMHPEFGFHYSSAYSHAYFGRIAKNRNLKLNGFVSSKSEFFRAYFFNRSMICSSSVILEKKFVDANIYPGISHEEDLLVWPSLVQHVPLFCNSSTTVIIDKTPVSETSSSGTIPPSILWNSSLYTSSFWGKLCAARRLLYLGQINLALLKLPMSLFIATILEIFRYLFWRLK